MSDGTVSVETPAGLKRGEWLGRALTDLKAAVAIACWEIPLGQADSAARVSNAARETVEFMLGCECEVTVEDTSTQKVIFLVVKPMIEGVALNMVVS